MAKQQQRQIEKPRRRGRGRPLRFGRRTVAGTLHLPIAFWEVLEKYEGSRTAVLTAALFNEELLEELRATLIDRIDAAEVPDVDGEA